jgi:drug/metabolite transporter (DMT)-like permease
MEATVLVMMFPIIVAVAEVGLFGRKVGWRLLCGGAIAFLGTVLIAMGASKGQSGLTGDLMALGAAVTYAGSLLISGQLCRRNPASAVTFWILLGAALGTLPAAWWEPSIAPDSAYGWAYVAVYGGLTFAAYALFNTALTKLPTTLVAVSSYGQPVIATSLAFAFLGEVPALGSLLGSAVIVAGLLFAMLGR